MRRFRVARARDAKQTEQRADRALIATFTDAQHGMAVQGREQPTAFMAGQFAAVRGIAVAGNRQVIRQQPPHDHRSPAGLSRALDQIVGVLWARQCTTALAHALTANGHS